VTKLDDDWNFDFSTISETEFKESQLKSDDKVASMYKMIVPLIDNLLKDSDKPYIHWPNRSEKLLQFKEKLNNILNGD